MFLAWFVYKLCCGCVASWYFTLLPHENSLFLILSEIFQVLADQRLAEMGGCDTCVLCGRGENDFQFRSTLLVRFLLLTFLFLSFFGFLFRFFVARSSVSGGAVCFHYPRFMCESGQKDVQFRATFAVRFLPFTFFSNFCVARSLALLESSFQIEWTMNIAIPCPVAETLQTIKDMAVIMVRNKERKRTTWLLSKRRSKLSAPQNVCWTFLHILPHRCFIRSAAPDRK